MLRVSSNRRVARIRARDRKPGEMPVTLVTRARASEGKLLSVRGQFLRKENNGFFLAGHRGIRIGS